MRYIPIGPSIQANKNSRPGGHRRRRGGAPERCPPLHKQEEGGDETACARLWTSRERLQPAGATSRGSPAGPCRRTSRGLHAWLEVSGRCGRSLLLHLFYSVRSGADDVELEHSDSESQSTRMPRGGTWAASSEVRHVLGAGRQVAQREDRAQHQEDAPTASPRRMPWMTRPVRRRRARGRRPRRHGAQRRARSPATCARWQTRRRTDRGRSHLGASAEW